MVYVYKFTTLSLMKRGVDVLRRGRLEGGGPRKDRMMVYVYKFTTLSLVKMGVDVLGKGRLEGGGPRNKWLL